MTMVVGPALADLPDFWGIAAVVGVVSFVLVLIIPISEKYSVAACFPAFASVVFWWIATGLDGWAEDGGGVGNSIEVDRGVGHRIWLRLEPIADPRHGLQPAR